MKKYILTNNYKIIDTSKYHHFGEHYDSEKGYYLISAGEKERIKIYENEIKAQADSVFDFIEIDGNWKVKYRYGNFNFVVQEKIKEKALSTNQEYYVFNQQIHFNEGDVGKIYHKNQKGKWLLVWSRENEK